MLYRENPQNKEKISILGYGAMRLPQKGMKINYEEAKQQLLHCINKGINYLDTAWPYHNGESEKFLGRVIAEEGIRDKVKFADKLPPWLLKSHDDMEKIFNVQLERLQTDYIDYYLMHALDGGAWDNLKKMDVFSFIKKIKDSGKVKNIGFSFHGEAKDFIRIVDDYDWDFCQIQYNILDERTQAGKAGLEYAAKKGLGVIIMEPLRGGNLANTMPKEAAKIYSSAPIKRSNVEWALRWIWNHPEVLCVLSGMNNLEHINQNIEIANEAKANSLTEKELNIVSRVAQAYRSAMKVPCTACQYCMPCPFGVNIPESFQNYNNYHMFGKKFMSKAMYHMMQGKLTKDTSSLASLCKNCGKCVSHCPQSIDIPNELKHVKKDMEGFFTTQTLKVLSYFMRNMNRGDLK
jgi:predicted aldo/keto reductase-like oxidoreductase